MKSVQIPCDLFIDLAMYHLRGEDDFEEEIRQGLEQKLDAMLNRQLYSRYKTAPTEEEREQARQCIDCYPCAFPVPIEKPAEASAEAAYPLGEPTILCSRRMKVS